MDLLWSESGNTAELCGAGGVAERSLGGPGVVWTPEPGRCWSSVVIGWSGHGVEMAWCGGQPVPAELERCQSDACRPGVVMLPRWSGAGAVPVVPGWRLVGDGVVLE